MFVELARASESLGGFDRTMHQAPLLRFWISENGYPEAGAAAARSVTTWRITALEPTWQTALQCPEQNPQ